MKASELVVKAFYLSNIVSRELETVSGSQISDGIDLLNELLDDKAASGNMIPYFSHVNFDAVVNQEKYFIPSLMEMSCLAFKDGTIRYEMRELGRIEYFGNTRATNISSFPKVYTFERALGGSNIYIYFYPDRDYEFEITGKFFLSNVSACDDLDSSLEGFYISYLRYALAESICDFYNVEFPIYKKQALNKKEKNLFKVDPPDMTIEKVSSLNSRENILNYAEINFNSGLRP
ncbi:hypothetical protein [uncultured Paraglaciecola sp.]|uniref:hypothetical protein n=1 Tax=uncultured Paraglaciecola sp. TaxID=1765024 RepID=UPI002613660A|nr:hypothetical protein [uncultured Paraglaciecola sp.]